MACPGQGPRALGRRSSRLGSGNLLDEPPDIPGPKIHLGRTLEEEDSHLGLCGRGSVFSAGREPGVGGLPGIWTYSVGRTSSLGSGSLG